MEAKQIEIGQFKIQWIDEDSIMVTMNYGDGNSHTAKIAGGDMETFLSGIFISAEMTYESNSVITKTIYKTTYK